jgi:hypothetical protein
MDDLWKLYYLTFNSRTSIYFLLVDPEVIRSLPQIINQDIEKLIACQIFAKSQNEMG